MSVNIVINNVYTKIVGYLPDNIQEELEYILCYSVQGAFFSKKYKEGKWDGKIHLYYRNNQQFYTGLLAFVRNLFKSKGIEYNIVDEREKPEKNYPELEFIPPDRFESRQYQDFAIERSIKHTRGILGMATGSGKTLTMVRLISQIKIYPFVFFVLTKDLMYQAYEVLSECLNVPIGLVGDGKCDIKKITVCTIQTAIRAQNYGKKIKVSDFKFDSEDKWDEKGIDSAENAEKIRKLLNLTKGVFFDECVTGDTEIVTEMGKMRIDQIPENNCRFVLSYDGNKIIYKPIENWMDKGLKEIIEVKFSDGETIRCTKDHMIYAESGWKEAKDLAIGEKVLGVNVDVGHGSKQISMEEKRSTFWVIKSSRKLLANGKRVLGRLCHQHLCVDVGVENKFLPLIRRSILLSIPKGRNVIQNISKGMTNSEFIQNITLSLQKLKNKLSSVHAWVTHLFYCQTSDPKITGCQQLTVLSKNYGFSTSLNSYQGLELRQKQSKMQDMGSCQPGCGPDVYHALPISQMCCMSEIKNESHTISSNAWEKLDWLGGFVMTEAISINECHLRSIHKVGVKMRILLWRSGSMIKGIVVKCQKAKDTFIYCLMSKGLLGLKMRSNSIFQNACNTNWKIVADITDAGVENVYDISVKDTHCFFGNNILVHNCHHVASRTAKDVMVACKNAYWRFAGSATPYREDGASILIQAMFGAKIVDISASYLIKEGYLVKPYIHFVPIETKIKYKSYAEVYKNCIEHNDEFNEHVAKTANHLIANGMTVLILVQRYAQGDTLKEMIPDCEFVKGSMTSKKRNQVVKDMRDGNSKAMIATSLADEGLDITSLDAVILAGGGKSAVKTHQRIGRALRQSKDKKKEKAIVIIYDHKVRFLSEHTKKIKTILKKEKEYVLIDSKGTEFICEEIDELLGIKNSNNIFDL